MGGTVHLIIIGDELLSGSRRDLHLQTLARDMTAHGARVASCEVIRDEEGAVKSAIQRLLAPGAAIITTGGLGPTLDDLTREGISAATGVGLHEEPSLWEDLKARYQRMGRQLSQSNRSQALVPDSGTWFHNAQGTAPGLVFEPAHIPDCRVIALPGPPRELNPMWKDQAMPYLSGKCGWPPPPFHVLMRFAQIGESNIDECMRPFLKPYPGIELSSLIRIGRVDVTLRLPSDYPQAPEILTSIADKTCAALAEYLYNRTDYFGGEAPMPLDFEQAIINSLRGRGEKLAVAESCTGGLLASWITNFPGSSDVFHGGVVVYSNSMKESMLGVSPATLEAHGAVSEETVREMALGVIERSGSDWGIAISGIAGPGGGTPEKPVGLVCLAVGNKERMDVHRSEFPGGRDSVRERAAIAAMRILWSRLSE